MIEKIYRVAVTVVICTAVAIASFFLGSRYCIGTVKAWIEPDVGKIAIQEFTGNISWHYLYP